jgi:hypothetical protein
MKSLLFTLSACALFFLSAGEEILFQSNFKENRELKNWFDVGNGYIKGVPQPKPVKQLKSAKTVESSGEVILQTTSTFMGITHKFSKPVLVDDNLKSITLKVVFHQNPKYKSSVTEFALTSRIQPALTNGGPFWRGRDSGISIRGYSYSSQAPNFIYWRKEGSDNKKFHSTAPYNMFPVSVVKNWTTAVLSYDHEKKILSFQCDSAKPFIYHNVDLKGIELNSCFVSCNMNEYKSIEVLCVKK